MNIAFPALVVLLLVLPGILLRYTYRKGFFWKSPVVLGPITDELGGGIAIALVLHYLGIAIVQGFSGERIDFDSLLILLTGWPKVDALQEQRAIDAVAQHYRSIFAYLTIMNAAAALFGYGAYWFVRATHLDIRYTMFRFSNEWHYLFWGERRAFNQNFQDIRLLLKQSETELTFISAVVDESGEAMLYWGALSDYYFDRSGELDLIVLRGAARRKLSDDKLQTSANVDSSPVENEDDTFITGDYLTLRYANIKNLNVQFYRVHDEDQQVSSRQSVSETDSPIESVPEKT